MKNCINIRDLRESSWLYSSALKSSLFRIFIVERSDWGAGVAPSVSRRRADLSAAAEYAVVIAARRRIVQYAKSLRYLLEYLL